MTRRVFVLLSTALLVVPAAGAAPRVLVVRCGALIADAAQPPIRDATIVITDGRITAVGAAPTPSGAEELDLRR